MRPERRACRGRCGGARGSAKYSFNLIALTAKDCTGLKGLPGAPFALKRIRGIGSWNCESARIPIRDVSLSAPERPHNKICRSDVYRGFPRDSNASVDRLFSPHFTLKYSLSAVELIRAS